MDSIPDRCWSPQARRSATHLVCEQVAFGRRNLAEKREFGGCEGDHLESRAEEIFSFFLSFLYVAFAFVVRPT